MTAVTATGRDGPEPGSLVREQMIAAFARAASTIAWEDSLQRALDHLSEEVLTVSSASACGLLLVSRFGNSVELFGSAGYPEGSLELLNEGLALGAPLISLEAYRSRVEITRDVASTLASDARFGPLNEIGRRSGWTTLVSIPMTVREERVGVLTALYSKEHEPGASDISFLKAMAHHGAMAINTARLLADARKRAALEERNRIARDLHDAVSQALFSIRLRTKALQIVAQRTEDSTGKLSPGLQALESVVDHAVEDMRALVFQLRPADLRGNDLGQAVKRYAEAISNREAQLVEVHVSGELAALPHRAEIEIYHIAREAIGNGIDHAGASRLTVEIGMTWRNGAGYLFMEVADDGVGFDPAQERPGHAGLDNMRARAAELGAELTIASGSAGTTVRLEVPLSRHDGVFAVNDR